LRGNGRQDAGESGLANTRVRILDAATGIDAVPYTTTDAMGSYSFRVLADKQYQRILRVRTN